MIFLSPSRYAAARSFSSPADRKIALPVRTIIYCTQPFWRGPADSSVPGRKKSGMGKQGGCHEAFIRPRDDKSFMATALFSHAACFAHDPGARLPDCSDLLRAVLAVLEPQDFPSLYLRSDPPAHPE